MAVAAALASAAILGVAETVPGLGWLALLGLAPLCLALRGGDFFADWTALAIFGGAFTLITADWIRLTGAGFGRFVPAAMAYQILLMAVPAVGLWIAGRRGFERQALLLLPVFWVALEMMERRAFFGVSWALLGLPLADYPALREAAGLAGPEALTFLAAAAGVGIALALRGAGRVRMLAIAQAVTVLTAALLYGEVAGESTAPVTARIAVVQPMIPQETRWDRAEVRPALLQRLNRLIDRAAAQSPRLIVLPEGSLPGLVHRERDLADFATGAVQRTGRPLLFGTVDSDDSGNFYNAAVRIGTDGTVNTYHKRRLAPFAERTPWPFHYTPPEGWVQFTPGSGSGLMPMGSATSFGVVMCLEDTYPDLARDAAANGATLLISLVNTESFKDTSQPLAHLRRAQLTAAASGMPMVRAANSGISCSLDAHGRVLASLPANRETAAALPVSAVTAGTLYAATGDAGVLALLALWTGMAAMALRMRIRITIPLPGKRRRRKKAGSRPVTA